MLHVLEMVWSHDQQDYIGRRTRELPASVTPVNVASYCAQAYGEPLDDAWTHLEDGTPLRMGWTFRVPPTTHRLWFEDRDPDRLELVAIPMLVDDHGELVPLFETLRRIRNDVEALQRDGVVDRVIPVAADEEWVPEPEDGSPRTTPPVRGDDPGESLERAVTLISDKRPTEALAITERLLAEPDGIDASDRALVLTQHGNALSDLARFDEALAAYADARALLDGADDGHGVAQADMEIAITLERIGRPVEAQQRYLAALAGYEQHGADEDVARCKLNAASTYAQLGDRSTQIGLLEEARAVLADVGDWGSWAAATHNLATALQDACDFDAARTIFEELLPAYRERGWDGQVADCLDALGVIAHEFCDFVEAERLHREAVTLYAGWHERVDEAIGRANLAHTLDHVGRHDEALAELSRAEAIAVECGAEQTVATARYLRAWVRIHRGEVDEALLLLAAVRASMADSGTQSWLPYLNWATGVALLVAGRAREAVVGLETATAGFVAVDSPVALADSKLDLARALRSVGRGADADRVSRDATGTFRRLGLEARTRA